MIAAIEEDKANYEKDVKITQTVDGWESTITWPADLKGDLDDVKAGGTATITYNQTSGETTVTYAGP